MMHRDLHRTDPVGCACTDCLVGYSAPVDQLTADEIEWVCAVDLYDASGLTEREWNELKGVDER